MYKYSGFDENFLSYLNENEQGMLEYFFRKLGFDSGDVLSKFVKELYKTYAESADDFICQVEDREDSDDYESQLEKRRRSFCARMIFYNIKNEYDFKSNKKPHPRNRERGDDYKTIIDFLAKYNKQDYVTATDIANYVFCPSSLCISKSFSKYEKSKEAVIGTVLHEQNKLVSYVARTEGKFKLSETTTREGIYSE